MWSTIDFWVEEISRDIVEVWFSDLYGYWRTRLSLDFDDIVLAGRAGFALKIFDVNKITKLKFVSHVY